MICRSRKVREEDINEVLSRYISYSEAFNFNEINKEAHRVMFRPGSYEMIKQLSKVMKKNESFVLDMIILDWLKVKRNTGKYQPVDEF